MRIKSALSMLLVLCMILATAACTGTGTPPATAATTAGATTAAATTAAPATTAAAAEITLPNGMPLNDWQKKVGWEGKETTAELYEAAKKEGKVVIYSLSSRIKNVVESFQKDYPDVVCEGYDISTNELLEKIKLEYTSGIRNCDVVHVKDTDGSIWEEYTKAGIFKAWYPADIAAQCPPESLKYGMPLYYELNYWFYNDELNPGGSPISSWWDVTKPEFKGKFMINDPVDNLTMLATVTAMCSDENAKLLADDYKKVFGKDIELTNGNANAGYELLYRIAKNDPVFQSSSGAIVEAVGTSTKDAPVGYSASTKARERTDKGWKIMPALGFTPAMSVYGLNSLFIVDEAPHPAAAKLAIRYYLGDADGSAAGLKPFNIVGGWPARQDVKLAEGNVPMSDVGIFHADLEYIYANANKVADFWIANRN